MKEIGKLESTSIRSIRDLHFKGGMVGFFRQDAWLILARHQTIQCYMVREPQGLFYRFSPHALFDIMMDPQTKKQWAVFIDNVFDEHSDVLRIEVTD